MEDVEEEEEPPSTVSKISKLTSKFFSSKSSKTSSSLKKSPSKSSKSTDVTSPAIKPSAEDTSPPSPKKFLVKSTGITPPAPKKSPSKSNLRTGEVLNKAAKFENQQLLSPAKTKDPALMSVSERKALFEKNKGAALVPKAAFGMAAPVKNSEKNAPVPAPAKLTHKKTPPSPKSKTITSPTKSYIAESGGIASKMKALLEKKSTISQSTIAHSIQEQRQKDLDLLLKRFNKNKDGVRRIGNKLYLKLFLFCFDFRKMKKWKNNLRRKRRKTNRRTKSSRKRPKCCPTVLPRLCSLRRRKFRPHHRLPQYRCQNQVAPNVEVSEYQNTNSFLFKFTTN